MLDCVGRRTSTNRAQFFRKLFKHTTDTTLFPPIGVVDTLHVKNVQHTQSAMQHPYLGVANQIILLALEQQPRFMTLIT